MKQREIAKLESERPSKKKGRAGIPPSFEAHEEEIKLVCRKAALVFHPWPDERWLKHKHRPRDVDWKDATTRYQTQKSKDEGYRAELWDYLKGEDCPVDLCKLLGRQVWFRVLVSYSLFRTYNLLIFHFFP